MKKRGIFFSFFFCFVGEAVATSTLSPINLQVPAGLIVTVAIAATVTVIATAVADVHVG